MNSMSVSLSLGLFHTLHPTQGLWQLERKAYDVCFPLAVRSDLWEKQKLPNISFLNKVSQMGSTREKFRMRMIYMASVLRLHEAEHRWKKALYYLLSILLLQLYFLGPGCTENGWYTFTCVIFTSYSYMPCFVGCAANTKNAKVIRENAAHETFWTHFLWK